MATMTNTQRLPFVLEPKDAAGNPAPIQGVPVYASSDETIAIVQLDSADNTGKTGWFASVAPSDTVSMAR